MICPVYDAVIKSVGTDYDGTIILLTRPELTIRFVNRQEQRGRRVVAVEKNPRFERGVGFIIRRGSSVDQPAGTDVHGNHVSSTLFFLFPFSGHGTDAASSRSLAPEPIG